MGIREANNLAGIAGVGENFLIAGEGSIENDFAAAARASARRTAVKNSSVLEREYRATCEGLRQCVLQKRSFRSRVYSRGRSQGTEMVHRPVCEYCFSVNKGPPDGAKDARIVGAIAVIAHHEVLIGRNHHRAVA